MHTSSAAAILKEISLRANLAGEKVSSDIERACVCVPKLTCTDCDTDTGHRQVRNSDRR